MAKRRHGGLGRGLDALIPLARAEKPSQESAENTDNKENADSAAVTEKAVTEKTEDEKSAAGKGTAEKAVPGNALPDDTGNLSETIPAAGTGNTPGSVSGNAPAAGTGNVPGDISGTAPGTASAKDTAGVRMLRLSQVDPNRSQPRRRFEEESLEELADSIRQFGVLQPILVQKKDARYEIIAGERRWRASRKAGLKEIPAVVREYSDEEAVELSLIENIQREDLNPIEEAKAFKRLLDEFGLRQEDLAARVSKSRAAITNAVRLLKLDERVQDMIVEEQLSMGHARALIPVEIPEEQFLLAQEVADKKLSVREVEKLVKKRLSKPSGRKGVKKGGQADEDPALLLAYRAIEERLKQSLGTKASIRHGTGGAGRIEIEFYSHEDLEKIVDLLT